MWEKLVILEYSIQSHSFSLPNEFEGANKILAPIMWSSAKVLP